MYKKIYLEITNNCNLDCSFCIKNNRDKKFMSMDEYKIILDRLKSYTKYLYFHVSGEPLLHPYINDFIDLGSTNYFINITTNGYLINRIKNNHNIRQINVSMHSFSDKYKTSLEKYMNDLISVIENLKSDTYFSLRFWVGNEYTKDMINILEEKYQKKIELKTGFEITKNVFVSMNKEFIWPDLKNDYYNEKGSCYALSDHIGILANGDIVPCCLDANCVIKLGNIFDDNLDSVIKSDRYIKMLDGFKNNKKIEELCKKCNFLE